MKLNSDEKSFLRAYSAIKKNKVNLGIVYIYIDLLYKLTELERRRKDDWLYDLPEFINKGTFVSYIAMLCLVSIDILAAFIDVKVITKTFFNSGK